MTPPSEIDPAEYTDEQLRLLFGLNVRTSIGDGGSMVVEFSDKAVTGRRCGGCTLCCKLLPVVELQKAASQRCRHQITGKGCRIYRMPTVPLACKIWSCRWLTDAATTGMPRPDRCHYVVDVMLDVMRMTDPDGTVREPQVLQVWVDPAFPDAHQAPELRAYMARMAEEHHLPTIIRWGSRQAMVVFPPAISDDGQWHTRGSRNAERSAADGVGLRPMTPEADEALALFDAAQAKGRGP